MNADMRSWSKLPTPPSNIWAEGCYARIIKDIVVHKGKLSIIDKSTGYVNEWNEKSQQWIEIDSSYIEFRTDAWGDEDNRVLTNIHTKPRSLASDGKHLFVAGNKTIPMVYMGDYGEPYGNIRKGWRKIRTGWCPPENVIKSCKLSVDTYSLDVIGDTLYAAAWEGLMKFPLKNLDKVIENENDYFF